MKNKSILFVRPDYHCSFVYRDQLRELGWKADILVNYGYPKTLLYSDKDVIISKSFKATKYKALRWFNHLVFLATWSCFFWRYKFHFYYGRPPINKFIERSLGFDRIFGKDFLIELFLLKLFSKKIIYLPTGCNEDETKEFNSNLEGEDICGNCGMWNKCHDTINKLNSSRINRYFDMAIGTGIIDSSQFCMTHLKYKSVDLELWHPNLSVPSKHRLPETGNIRILHSNFLAKSGRAWQGRNEKGSPQILDAINRLKDEGYPVEYYFIDGKPSNEMRFYQVQADIVVEQLYYGWWGSTGVETMSLGKPVVCYLRPVFVDLFYKTFPEYKTLPIIEANVQTIYKVLRNLVENKKLRETKGIESRRFAESHFDPRKNVPHLANELLRL
jgi:glycosyltransferase involved in cell wall biosynthesis